MTGSPHLECGWGWFAFGTDDSIEPGTRFTCVQINQRVGCPHVVKIDLCTATRPVGYLEVRFFRSRSAHVVVPRSTLTHLQRSRCAVVLPQSARPRDSCR